MPTTLFRRKAVIASTIAAAAIAGGATMAAADAPPTSPSTSASAGTDEKGGKGETAIKGSIPAPPDTEDVAEQKALTPLATVDAGAAASAATAAVPGAAGTPQRKEEGGFVVYEVDVTQADGSVVEVTVDAGDASVLAQDDGTEGDEAALKGNVRAPAGIDDDTDGSEASEKAEDAAEEAALAQFATVDPAAATAAATAAVPGTAGTATLDEEDGFVVYEVDVTQADGSVVEVTVDAGDATVLAQEASDEDDD